jgi:two-component system, sporulation sensor kinase E
MNAMAQRNSNAGALRTPILLVDDLPANLLALRAVLASPDYDLVSAPSGSEALEQVKRTDFAVILLDVQMPTMDGVETALKIKQVAAERGQRAPIPIIFVTGVDAGSARVLHAYASGAVDFIQKPLEPDVIRAKVSVFVDLHRAKERLVTEIEERRRLQDALRAREDLLGPL